VFPHINKDFDCVTYFSTFDPQAGRDDLPVAQTERLAHCYCPRIGSVAICNIEDKRAAERAKERGQKLCRTAPGRLVEGQVVTNWKKALEQLSLVYPDRIERYL
jgi:hypothetical protein